jgi:hypothetical protein
MAAQKAASDSIEGVETLICACFAGISERCGAAR